LQDSGDFITLHFFHAKTTKMRKTTQKNSRPFLKIEKIDFKNSVDGSSILQNVRDVRFDLHETGLVQSDTMPDLKQIIEFNKTNKQLFLRFYAYPFERLPEEICELKHLQGLSILNCQLRRLPDSISHLTRLRHFFLIKNRLTELPDSLFEMQNLHYLDLSENQVEQIQNKFDELSKLTDLYLDRNQLTEFPKSIASLQKLVRLGLSGNQLSNLPEVAYEWHKLIRLNLADNRFTNLPDGFNRFSKLEWLNLSGNPLMSFPPSILKLPKLELFFLRDCGLIDLPKEFAALKTLQVLDISGNRFYGGKIPSVVFQLPLLEELIVMDCGIVQLVEEDFIALKKLCIIRLQNNKIRYLSRKFARMTQVEELNLAENPLEYVAPELAQLLPHPERLVLTNTPFEHLPFSHVETFSPENPIFDSFEPQVIAIREKYKLEKRRSFL
jgi:Leucine-rich repeat (LRR) protein